MIINSSEHILRWSGIMIWKNNVDCKFRSKYPHTEQVLINGKEYRRELQKCRDRVTSSGLSVNTSDFYVNSNFESNNISVMGIEY